MTKTMNIIFDMERRYGVRYEAGIQSCGLVHFPVTHVFPPGGRAAFGCVSIGARTPLGAPLGALLSWRIYDANGHVLLHGEAREIVCGSRRGMIKVGVKAMHVHGGKRVWPRRRAQGGS